MRKAHDETAVAAFSLAALRVYQLPSFWLNEGPEMTEYENSQKAHHSLLADRVTQYHPLEADLRL